MRRSEVKVTLFRLNEKIGTGFRSIFMNIVLWLSALAGLFLAGVALGQIPYCHWAGWLLLNIAGLVLIAGIIAILVEMGILFAIGVDYAKRQ